MLLKVTFATVVGTLIALADLLDSQYFSSAALWDQSLTLLLSFLNHIFPVLSVTLGII